MDIDNLIYTIEEKLPSPKYPVHNIVVIYLAAGSDFTEKWYNKSHATFLTQVEHVKDLFNESDYNLPSSHAYRKLIHAVWLCLKQDPEQTRFHQLQEATKMKADVRLRLPQENIIHQHFRRVAGIYRYMLSYVMDSGVIDW